MDNLILLNKKRIHSNKTYKEIVEKLTCIYFEEKNSLDEVD
jgi:hypothetical protein